MKVIPAIVSSSDAERQKKKIKAVLQGEREGAMARDFRGHIQTSQFFYLRSPFSVEFSHRDYHVKSQREGIISPPSPLREMF